MKASRVAVRRDERGSTHVLEVMIVGLMVAGGIMAVVTMNTPTDERYYAQVHPDPKHADDILSVGSVYAATASDIDYTHLLEQLMIEALRDGDHGLREWLYEYTTVTHHRLDLQRGPDFHTASGYSIPSDRVPRSGTLLWPSTMSTTLIQPTMSHIGPDQLAHLEVLPLHINQAKHQQLLPMQIDFTLQPATLDPPFHHRTTSSLRTPMTDLNPLLLAPTMPGHRQHAFQHVLTSDDLELDSENGLLHWHLHLRITPTQDGPNPWLANSDILRVHLPPGWGDPAVHSEDHQFGTPTMVWDILTPSEDAVQRYRYHGPVLGAGHSEAWLNLTITRDIDVLDHPTELQVLAIQMEKSALSRAYQVLVPDLPPAVQKSLPMLAFTSHPNPLPLHEAAPVIITITNPGQHEANLANLQVSFPGHHHQFHTPAPGWKLVRYGVEHGSNAVYTYGGALNIPARGAATVQLDLKMERAEGPVTFPQPYGVLLHGTPEIGRPQVPLYDEPFAHLIPQGQRGHHMAWLAASLLDSGDQVVHLPRGNEGLPPGHGAFTVLPAPHPVLAQLQEARSVAQLTVPQERVAPGDGFTVTLDTAGLLPLLRGLYELGNLSSDRVRMSVTAGDFLETVIGQPSLHQEYDLGLDISTRIVGLEWVPAGAGDYELIVAYSDGHLLALEGVGPEHAGDTRWRYRVADEITHGPYFLPASGDYEDRLVLFVRKDSAYSILVLDLEGEAIAGASRPLSGPVIDGVRVDCRGSPGIGFLIRHEKNGEIMIPGLGPFSPGSTGVTSRVGYYEDGARHYGPDLAMRGVAIDSGRYGPTGECSLIVGYANPTGLPADPGRIARYNLPGLVEMWHHIAPGDLHSIWSERVSSIPYEGLIPGVDQLKQVVYAASSEYGVVGGYVNDTSKPVSLPGFVPGDKLLGLSWVNPQVGYTASERGYVWRTTDGGHEWEMLPDTPIVEGAARLIAFAFGGSGNGVFVRDDKLALLYLDGSLRDWRRYFDDLDYRAVGETSDEPGVILYRPADAITALMAFDPETLSFDDLVRSVHCHCTEAFGHATALVGWTANTTHVNATAMSEYVYDLGQGSYAADAGGGLLGEEDQRLITFVGNTARLFPLHPHVASPLAGAVTSRSPHGAFLTHDSGLIGLHSDGHAFHMAAPGPGVVGLSGGDGAIWWVFEGKLQPLATPVRQLFDVRLSPIGEVDAYRLEGIPHEAILHWRLLTLAGASAWLSPSEVAAGSEFALLALEIETQPGANPAAPRLALLAGGETIATLAARNDATCTECLYPMAAPGLPGDSDVLWWGSDGLSTRFTTWSVTGHAAFLPGANGVYLLGEGSAGAWSHNVTIGLPWRTLAMPAHGPLTELEPRWYHEVDMGGGWVFGESGYGPTPQVPFLRPDGGASLRALDPQTGSRFCNPFTVGDAAGLAARVLAVRPDGALVATGTDIGRLSAMAADGCSMLWSVSPLETGSRLSLLINPAEQGSRGPVVVKVSLSIDLEALGVVELRWLVHVVRSEDGVALWLVPLRAHLHLWY